MVTVRFPLGEPAGFAGFRSSLLSHCPRCEWRVNATNASALADTLSHERDRALLFRTLATLRTDIVLFDDIAQLRRNGPTPTFADLATRLDAALTEIR